MYRVVVVETGETVALCSRKEDAAVYLDTKLDKQTYVIKKVDSTAN